MSAAGNEQVAVRLDEYGIAELVAFTRGDGPQVNTLLNCRCADVVRLAQGLDMWVDDEGLMVAEPMVNEVATRIARAYGFGFQPYVGPVLFASVDDEGETVGLTSGQISSLMATVNVRGAVVLDASVAVAADTVRFTPRA